MQKPESIEVIKGSKQLAMSEWELQALASVWKTNEYAEFMLCLPGGKEVLRHVVDDYSKLIYTTKADEVAAIARLAQERGVTRLEAIQLLAAQRAAAGRPA
jgi:conjugal transfer ATP-binding protein TraC